MAKTKGRESHPEGAKTTVSADERAEVKRLREAKGWSQKELATRARTTQGTISNLESGRTQPYLSVYQRIVAVLHGKEPGPASENSLRRISSGAARLDDANRRAVETLIEALLKSQEKRTT
jgi:transcriptional regulator with XRE-family HTH domain